jgi:hypothetical protein
MVKDYGWQRDWTSARDGKAKYQTLWNDFFGWFETESLELTVTNDHDGVGYESWLVISAKPLDNTL